VWKSSVKKPGVLTLTRVSEGDDGLLRPSPEPQVQAMCSVEEDERLWRPSPEPQVQAMLSLEGDVRL
jgi:hypothetical protein